MRTIQFGTSDISKGFLILVNSSHPIKRDIPKKHLSPIRYDTADILLERQTVKMLSKITTLLRCENEIIPVSGYRNILEQRTIYMNSLRENGYDFTQKYVAVPGCSEHQTGLAIDLAKNGDSIDFIRPDFPYTGICMRFRELSIRYGFIERYPAGRERITQIAHEPWHFRYVGYPHSEIMKNGFLTLEEYITYLKQFPYRGSHMRFKDYRCDFEIFYVSLHDDREGTIEIPNNIFYRISENNEDGVVITLWKKRL